MSKFLTTIGAIVVAGPFIFGLLILAIMWRTWWLYPTWEWYVVPLGVRQVSFWHFAALMFLISVFTAHTSHKKDDRPMDWSSMLASLITPMLIWALLWWMREGR